MKATEVLFTPDTLLLIINHLDPLSLFSLRLTCSLLNRIILTHQRLICNSIISRELNGGLVVPVDDAPFTQTTNDTLASPFHDGRLTLPVYNGPFAPQNLHLKALARVEKAKFLAAHAARYGPAGDAEYGPMPLHKEEHTVHPIVAGLRARIACGILIIWALIDIQQEANPKSPIPKYISFRKANAARLVSMSLLPRKVVQRFRPSTSKADTSLNPTITPEPASASHHIDQSSLLLNSLDTTKSLETIRQAQQSFVSALDRKARVDLHLAREYLAEEISGSLGCFYGLFRHGTEHWWKEDWALRQGPEFIEALVSKQKRKRAWAIERMREEWDARPLGAPEPVGHSYAYCFPDPEGSAKLLETVSAQAWRIKSDVVFTIRDMVRS